jgi:hypothetical protein
MTAVERLVGRASKPGHGRGDRRTVLQTVERVFSLDKPSLAKEYENPTSKDDDKVSEPAVAVTEIERKSVKLEPVSLEEIRREARENWLQMRQRMVSEAKTAGHSKSADRGAKEDNSHSKIEDDLDE